MSSSYFHQLGNRAPSTHAEKAILLEAIGRDKKILESVRIYLRDSEPKWKAANDACGHTKRLLDDAILRLQVASALKNNTCSALTTMEDLSIGEAGQARLDDQPAAGVSHTSVVSRLLSQQERPIQILRDRVSLLEDEESKARAAVEKERDAYNFAQVQLCSLAESIGFYKLQEEALECSIQSKRRVLSATRRLTEDNWLSIFHFVVGSWEPTPVDKSRIMVENPALALSHICQQWAKVFREKPALWRHIYIKSLALERTCYQYLDFCLSKIGGEIATLHVHTRVGMVSQARILTNSLKGLNIHHIQIYATKHSADAAEHLIESLPTPRSLYVCEQDVKLAVKNSLLVLKARPRSPEKLMSIKLEDCFLRSGSTHQGSYSAVQELTMDFKCSMTITSSMAKNFTNLTAIVIKGANPSKRQVEGRKELTFPRLRHLTGSLLGVIDTFDASCKIPVLSALTTWINHKECPLNSAWKRFLDRDDLKTRLELVEILDMAPDDAGSMLPFLLELPKLPRLTIMGRCVDSICQNLANVVAEGGVALESVIVRDYAGDGSSVLNLVRSRKYEPHSRQTPEIMRVAWFDCDNVSLQMRRDVERLVERHGYHEASAVAI